MDNNLKKVMKLTNFLLAVIAVALISNEKKEYNMTTNYYAPIAVDEEENEDASV